ncbi:MAG: RagB/SusD family nutrient uptake outer membrane protein, partial [Tissierellia bacterium]|nr:RagB/SusD family nutrient uptake outer membrane protein [Tissierellia bacterium]
SNFGNVGVFQEAIDAFFMDNGLEITDPGSGYSTKGFTKVRNYTRLSSQEKYDEHISNMYANREPRFYQAITYEGRSWYQDITTNKLGNNYRVFFSRGGGADNSSSENPRTGYMLNKFKNRNLLNQGTNVKQWGRPWIIFRLADFYLYYAEVLNEINPSDPNIITYLDIVRERAGIPTYRDLAANGTKNIIGNQELQRDAIRKERRVELFAEGNRYFDIRRWMTADDENGPDQQLKFTGLNMNVPAAKWDASGKFESYLDDDGVGSFYERIVIENRAWRRAMLFYPIPYNEIQKSNLLVQNPLW